MSDTTDSSSSFPTLSDIGDALSDITTADGESVIHPPTLSGIAKELLLVEAHYATEEAGLRKRIEELESTVRCQAKSMASQEVVIKCRVETKKIEEVIKQQDELMNRKDRIIKWQEESMSSKDRIIKWQEKSMSRKDETIKRQDKSIDGKNEIIKRQGECMKVSDSRIATLVAQRDTLQSKGDHQLNYPNRTICVPIPPNSLSHEDSPLSHTPGTGSHTFKELSNEASRETASKTSSQPDKLNHPKISSTISGPSVSHFKRLPLDLQRKIWRLTFPEPRILEARWSGTTLDCDFVHKVPVAMHICQDARREALSEYHQFTFLPYVGLVDLKHDTVYVTWVADTYITAKPILSKLRILFSFWGIRHLAIHSLLWCHLGERYGDKLFEMLTSMKELQELTIISLDKVPENTRVERRQGIEFSGVTLMDSTLCHFLKHPRWQPFISKIRYGSVKRRSVSTEPSDNPLKSSSTPTNLEDFSTKPISTLEAAIANPSVGPASTPMQINPFANPSVSPASTPVRIDVFSGKRANPPAKSVSTLEAATHPSVKPVVSTPTMTADTPAILLPTPETTLTTPDKPVPPPTLKPHCESKFPFGKPTPIPVSPSKFARGLKPHHTHTRSKSAELRASPAMSPFPSRIPFEEPEGWKPEDWKKYLRFGPPTAENVF
ncbi:hypothetical protein V500_03759 [Pseudogymnoascus sp. VKM F-4518 (FW-2643)]|nr:hypothetical protein V500_03759 [Pseudogymnoascus sp. VKM F-4518 (FW-2643)]